MKTHTYQLANRIVRTLKPLDSNNFDHTPIDLGVNRIGYNDVHVEIKKGALLLSDAHSPLKGNNIPLWTAKQLNERDMRELLREVASSLNRPLLIASSNETAKHIAKRIRNVRGLHTIDGDAFSSNPNGTSGSRSAADARYAGLKRQLESEFDVIIEEISGSCKYQFSQMADKKNPVKFVQAIQALLDFGVDPRSIDKL